MAVRPVHHRVIRELGQQFDIQERFLMAAPHGSGHINDTYAATYQLKDTVRRYIHQRINHQIFKNPPLLMENICRVTDHLRSKLNGALAEERPRRVLQVIRAQDGNPFYRDDDGNYWRTYAFIENTISHDIISTPDQAREAARAFGQFQAMLTDLPAPRLEESIPLFHHTPSRFTALVDAIQTDAFQRAVDVQKEIDFVMRREPVTRHLLDLHQAGRIPERITHNDTKINNVMMDSDTHQGMCVIDLDTVMPGLALYDFGDMVRTATSPAPEDERDLSKVTMRLEIFEALAEGYLEAMGAVLTPTEFDHLAYSGKLIALEIGIRFLTDHLSGDPYFKIHRPNHNLDRARTQFRLVESIEAQEEQMAQSAAAILATR